MKKWELIFTEKDDGTIGVSSMNQGFNSMELIALLESKKTDILAQISPETVFKRILVEDDGTKVELKEEN